MVAARTDAAPTARTRNLDFTSDSLTRPAAECRGLESPTRAAGAGHEQRWADPHRSRPPGPSRPDRGWAAGLRRRPDAGSEGDVAVGSAGHQTGVGDGTRDRGTGGRRVD